MPQWNEKISKSKVMVYTTIHYTQLKSSQIVIGFNNLVYDVCS